MWSLTCTFSECVNTAQHVLPLSLPSWRAQGGALRVARASARGMRAHLVVEKLAEAPPDDEVEFGFRVVENACRK